MDVHASCFDERFSLDNSKAEGCFFGNAIHPYAAERYAILYGSAVIVF